MERAVPWWIILSSCVASLSLAAYRLLTKRWHISLLQRTYDNGGREDMRAAAESLAIIEGRTSEEPKRRRLPSRKKPPADSATS